MSFVHLHTHTHYSLLDGLTKIDEMVAYAKEQGSPALAITDHGVMYGAIDFYKECKKQGIKPIIGAELYMARESRHKKDSSSDRKNYHLILLAKNKEGYKNLIKLTSIGFLEGFYYKPKIDWEVLQKYSKGLIATSACLGGEISQLILSGQIDKVKKRIKEFKELFGKDHYYLEMQHHPNSKEQIQVNEKIIELSRELDVPLVATNDVHYLTKEDAEAQDILLCLQNKKKLTDENRMNMMDFDVSMRSNKEMADNFSHVPEAISNTVKISEMCNLEIKLNDIQLPHFDVPDGYDGMSYLKYLSEEGMKKRYGKTVDEMDEVRQERLKYELSIIAKMGWPSYFLIVADFVTWSREQGIVVGPGRGSAAGSLVCYLTGITNIDPIEYDLLFERFLNPERISMPDIDLDFADTRRAEVICYVEDKYGKDHVAQIITFGTMAARASIRDVGRVLDVPYDFCDHISKSIPMFTGLQKALDTVPDFKELYTKEPDAKRIIDYALRLEGVSRHASTHACGVLITKEPVDSYAPVQYAASGDEKVIVSQYSLHPVEDLGLLKMDFLGLKNLTIIESAVNIIKKTKGVDIDIEKIPLDDPAAYKLFQNGGTTGVFQFESSGMRRYLKELKPTEFEDIIAMVALYRPGPMEWIPDYIAGKHGREVKYLHPKLEPILKTTHGVAIYQEQVMRMARDLAGFTMGEADVLRKAMGKKIVKLLAEQKEKFLDGCVKNTIPKNLAEKIFSFIEPFAGYGFNRSHAACYALIGYQTAYLKAHYPTEFIAALLTADQQNTERIAIEIEECRNTGIEVFPPDINESFNAFTVVNDKTIRFGLNAIKNVGEHIVEVLIEERKANGKFKSIFDLFERITDKDLNKKSIDSLIKCGAFDQFETRDTLLHNLDSLLSLNKEMTKIKESGQNSLFGDGDSSVMPRGLKLIEGVIIPKQEKLSWEKELLGLYVLEHPFNEYKKYIGDKIISISKLPSCINCESVKTAGVIASIKKIMTKNNKSMLFVKIEDAIASTEILVFPRLLEKTKELWQEGKTVLCQGKISDKDQEIKILADKIIILELDTIAENFREFESIKVAQKRNFNFNSKKDKIAPDKNTTKVKPLGIALLKSLTEEEAGVLKEILSNNSGENKVYFKLKYEKEERVIETDFKVDNNEVLWNLLEEKLKDKIKVSRQ